MLYINTLPLELGGFGIGSYTRDIILALGSSPAKGDMMLLCPAWLAGHPAVVDSGIALKVIGPARLPKAVRRIAWMEYVGWWLSRQHGSVFFSPAPWASFFNPSAAWVTCHDCLPLQFSVYLGKNPLRKMSFIRALRFLRVCSGVITDSEASKRDIIAACEIPPDRVHVVYCWVSSRFNRPDGLKTADAMRRKYGLPERYWLYLGGYDVRKNVPHLLTAYADAKAISQCPPLVLAGNIPTRFHPTLCDVYGTITDLGLDKSSILMPGFVPDSDLPGLYAGAELFIYPSLGEGFGLPPLEAMSCGCPAIVADNSSLREVVPDPGYRFTTTDPSQLKELLATAALQPLPMNPTTPPFSSNQSLDNLLQLLMSEKL